MQYFIPFERFKWNYDNERKFNRKGNFFNIYINGKGLNCDILRLRRDSNLFNDLEIKYEIEARF